MPGACAASAPRVAQFLLKLTEYNIRRWTFIFLLTNHRNYIAKISFSIKLAAHAASGWAES
jgi:hypothetical protein